MYLRSDARVLTPTEKPATESREGKGGRAPENQCIENVLSS